MVFLHFFLDFLKFFKPSEGKTMGIDDYIREIIKEIRQMTLDELRRLYLFLVSSREAYN